MHRAENLPQSIARFQALGGEVQFAAFDDAPDDPDAWLDAICEAVPDVDREALRALGFRVIDEATFYGDRYDLSTHSLVASQWVAGGWTQKAFNELGEAWPDVSGEWPAPGDGGQFALAFCAPPYRMQASAGEIQSLFDKIRVFILPPRTPHRIHDWADPKLASVSTYFRAGMEWWGVYLFTIYLPEYRRLTVIFASTTD